MSQNTHLAEDSEVLVSISGRMGELSMTWQRARKRYVQLFGPSGIQECREALEQQGRWRGYCDPQRETWLSVAMAQEKIKDAS